MTSSYALIDAEGYRQTLMVEWTADDTTPIHRALVEQWVGDYNNLHSELAATRAERDQAIALLRESRGTSRARMMSQWTIRVMAFLAEVDK